MAPWTKRLQHAWNAFTKGDGENRMQPSTEYYGSSYGRQPYTQSLRISGEKTIISSIYTRLAIDVASVDIRHVRLDDQKRYLEDIDSGINNCLTLEANIDQAATAFRRDIAFTLFDDGVAVLVPIDTTINPLTSGGYDILSMRVGTVVSWHSHHVRVSVYNEATQQREEVTLPKKMVAIIDNPLYQVMNEQNSTLKRLVHKLSLLDLVDDQSASGKLDLIIQLPYTIRSDARRDQADKRAKDIEYQLKGSKYGIAYTDATEKVTQLNRPAENNLLEQVKVLTEQLYVELGLTPEVMNGTADEAAILNYMNRTVEPILTAIVEGMRRSFLTKTARSQKQTIMFFKDVFKLVPVTVIAEIADKLTRNEILSSNEVRQILGIAPSSDPKADKLTNSNIPEADTRTDAPTNGEPPIQKGPSQNGSQTQA